MPKIKLACRAAKSAGGGGGAAIHTSYERGIRLTLALYSGLSPLPGYPYWHKHCPDRNTVLPGPWLDRGTRDDPALPWLCHDRTR